jgi:predicted ferric reductase
MTWHTFPWYVARASGLLGWALLTASVLWGLAISTKAKALGHRPRPAWLLDLHRYLGGLATIFTAVHVGAIVADSYVHFDLVSVLIPFASSWKPVAVAWGVVGMYLLLAVELTSLARRHLPRKVWRMTHAAAFPLFAVATLHGITAGTDGHSAAFVAAATVAVLAVAALTALRLRPAAPRPVRAVVPERERQQVAA